MLLLILQSLSKWLEIQAVRAHWNLSCEIERYCEVIESDMLEARTSGNDALADRLRSRLARASGIAVPSLGSVEAVSKPDVHSNSK